MARSKVSNDSKVHDSRAPVILDVQDVSFGYVKYHHDTSTGDNSDLLALKDISFTVREGEFVAIIGENGSGKTTLLKLIVGLLKSDKGTIKLYGKDISNFKEWSMIGYIPQRMRLSKSFPITVFDFVTLGLQSTKGIFSKMDAHDRDRIISALKEVDMLGYENRRISDLSGGQFQRVLLAKELVKRPKLIILDEPTVGVDITHQERFCCLLSNLNRSGITILIVTHDISFVSYHVNRIIGLNRSIIFDGEPDELKSGVLKKIFGHATVYSGEGAPHKHCSGEKGV